jgi:hypothetical protein
MLILKSPEPNVPRRSEGDEEYPNSLNFAAFAPSWDNANGDTTEKMDS